MYKVPIVGYRFRSHENGSSIDVDINDKLDIICPHWGRDEGVELFYFKLYLVTVDDFNKCSTPNNARKLLSCDIPEKEKKYTFYFQEISPSPWGLEFVPTKSYYVICECYSFVVRHNSLLFVN